MSRVFFDMDGVICNFDAHREAGNDPDAPGFFLELLPFPEGVRLFFDLMAAGHEVLIASTAPWENPSSWMEKRLWVAKHLGERATKRLTLTHRKDLLIGDFLIDDRTKNGAGEFQGVLVQYGSPEFPDWQAVRKFFVLKGLLPTTS